MNYGLHQFLRPGIKKNKNMLQHLTTIEYKERQLEMSGNGIKYHAV